MSAIIDCCLCDNTCNEFKRLYNEQQQCIVELYEIAAQYFHPMFLTLSKVAEVTALCLECWSLIVNFNSFQQRIMKTQAKLMRERKRKCLSESRKTTKLAEKSVEMATPQVGDIAIEATVKIKEEILEDIANPTESAEMPTPQEGNIVKTEYEFSTTEIVATKINAEPTIKIKEEFLENITNPGPEIVDNQRNIMDSQNKQENLSNLEIKEEILDLDSSFDSDMQEEFLPEKVNKSMEANQAEQNSDYEEPVGIFPDGEFGDTVQNDNMEQTEANAMDLENPETDAKLRKIIDFAKKNHHTEDERNEIIALWRPMINCPLCELPFQNVDMLSYHFLQNHPGQKTHMKCCRVKLRIRSQMAEHAMFHLNPNVFKCEHCNKCFRRQQSLKYHSTTTCTSRKIGAKNKDSKKNSDASSTTKATIVEPENSNTRKSHHNEKELDEVIASWQPMLTCPLCQSAEPNVDMLRQHFAQNHPGINSYIECCQLKFLERCGIAHHARFHLNPSIYKCEVYNKTFKCKSSLKRHRESHFSTNRGTKITSTKDIDAIVAAWKPILECDICQASHSTYTSLREHFQQQHSAEKFELLCCQQQLDNENNIVMHALKHATPSMALQCHLCSNLYVCKDKLIRHMHRFHGITKPKRVVTQGSIKPDSTASRIVSNV